MSRFRDNEIDACTIDSGRCSYSVSAAEWVDQMGGFHQGLSEIGFVESRNVALEYRWTEGR